MDALFRFLQDWIDRLNPFVLVGPWEQGVMWLGRWSWALGPGIYLRLPLAMKVVVLSCRLRSASFNRATFQTADGRNLTISGGVPYHITNARDLMMSTDMGEDVFMKMSGSLCREYAKKFPLEEIDADAMGAYVVEKMTAKIRGAVIESPWFVDFADIPTVHLLQTAPWGNTGSGGTLNLSAPMGSTR